MADFEREVTPAIKTTPPPAPLHSNRASFSFRVEGIRLTQSRGRLVVVNYVQRGLFIWSKCLVLLVFPLFAPLPPLSYWANLFHHATWQTLLSAVSAINWQPNSIGLLMFSLIAMLYWVLVTSNDFHGFILDRRSNTVKAAGRTRPLTDIKAVEVITARIKGRPDPCRGWIVRLVWSVEQEPSWWQLRERNKSLKTSALAIFLYPKDVTDIEKLAQAVAEFAKVPLQHQTWVK